jgi:hypothetical protein
VGERVNSARPSEQRQLGRATNGRLMSGLQLPAYPVMAYVLSARDEQSG